MYKLLLCDDEPIIREGIQRLIDWERLGLTLTASCADALSALDSMTDDMPDILLTDVRMPGMSGLELVERAVQLHPQLQCVILSGYDTFEYARQAMKYGVIEYLLKPCDRAEVEAALTRACREVDRRRGETRQLSRERTEQVGRLAEALLQLRGCGAASLTHQVQELAKTAADVSLLREALVRMITSSKGAQPDWALEILKDAFREDSTREEVEGQLVRCLTRLLAEDETGFVGRMTAYVDAHFSDESLSLQFLADQVLYMNADYIGREFSRAMGRKFSAYLLEIRMSHAKALMAADPALHSYEVAEQVGLGNNPHYFSQIFRKYTGMTPKEFRMAAAKKE